MVFQLMQVLLYFFFCVVVCGSSYGWLPWLLLIRSFFCCIGIIEQYPNCYWWFWTSLRFMWYNCDSSYSWFDWCCPLTLIVGSGYFAKKILWCVRSIGCRVHSIDDNLDDMFDSYLWALGLSQKEARKGGCWLLLKGTTIRMIKAAWTPHTLFSWTLQSNRKIKTCCASSG